MRPRIDNGWLFVACDAPDTAAVELGVGDEPVWQPAYRGWHGRVRTAQVRTRVGGTVWMRVDGHETKVGTV